MTIKRLLILTLFLLIAFHVNLNKAKTPSSQSSAISSQDALTSTQPASLLSLALEKGTLQIKTAHGAVLSGMKLRLRLSDGAQLAGELELAGQDKGTDSTGKYERLR